MKGKRPPTVAAQALGRFQNVKRRMAVRGTVNGITVYGDFAQHHHETRHHEGPGGRRHRHAGHPQVAAAAKPGDHILCMSNGGFGGVHGRLLQALSEQ